MTLDPRGQRFAAWLTSAVLAAVLLTQSGWLLLAQTVVFGIGAFVGMRAAPYALLYRYLVAPRLAPVREREAAAPVRFAQAVGFAFAAVGTVGFLAGTPLVGIIATAAALIAAFLNAAFGLCLGCLVYLRGKLLIARFTGREHVNPQNVAKAAPTHKGVSA
jgi:hypothetical protein